MNRIRYTLLSDGSSDRALMPVLEKALRCRREGLAAMGEWADLARLPRPPIGLAKRIRTAFDLYPCDLLFVHRDAEREPPEKRRREIEQAFQIAAARRPALVHVPLVPVRMQEAWLLVDERAIRVASGNPSGRIRLDMPDVGSLERLPDPKAVLYHLLRRASELRKRQLKAFQPDAAAHRIARYYPDLSVLRRLQAFRELETDMENALVMLESITRGQ